MIFKIMFRLVWFRSVGFVLLVSFCWFRLVWFRFVGFVWLVSFCWFRLVWFRLVSFRFANYSKPVRTGFKTRTMLFEVPSS